MAPRKKVAKTSSSRALTGAKTPPSATKAVAVKKTPAKEAAVKKAAVKKTASKAAIKRTATKTRSGQRSAMGKPSSIDEYLAQVDTDTKELLQNLRRTIHELVPEVVECISYSMPAFRYQGKVIAGFLATKAGASYFPFSGTTLGSLTAELKGRSQTKSGLHFSQAEPLPKRLVNTLLRARIAEL